MEWPETDRGISYADLVHLAVPDSRGDEILSVGYEERSGRADDRSGSLVPGQSIPVRVTTIFNVVNTSNA